MVWLYANNRVDEAERVIRHAAKLNNIAMPGSILASRSLEIIVPSTKTTSASATAAAPNDTICNYITCKLASGNQTPHETANGFTIQKGDNGTILSNLDRLKRAKEKAVSIKKTHHYTLLDVFRNFRLAMYCVCMSFLWFVTQLDVIFFTLTSPPPLQ